MRDLTIFALLALSTLSAAVDQTQVPGAAGEAVVNEVVAQLIPQVFPFDYGFLKRLAIGGTDNGNNPPTTTPDPGTTEPDTTLPPTTDDPLVPFRQHPKFPSAGPLEDAKIWPLTQDQFEETQTNPDPKMDKLRSLIQSQLGVDWITDVSFAADAAKPLHSAIATVFYAYSVQFADNKELLPMLLEDQAEFWAANFNPEADEAAKTAFIEAVQLAEEQDEGVCNRALDVVFLFDISLKQDDFAAARDKIKSLVFKYNKENVDDNTNVRFGLATFGKKADAPPSAEVLPLTLNSTEAELTTLFNGISAPLESIGESGLIEGLKKAIEMQVADNGVPEVIVMITSGYRTNFADPELDSALTDAKSKGIRLIVLGLQDWDHQLSQGLLDVVNAEFFILHFGVDPADVSDILTRAVHTGSCQSDRAPEDLPPADIDEEVTFKAGETKTWSRDIDSESLGVSILIPESGSGLGLRGWWCYNNNCARPSEAVHDGILAFGQVNTVDAATGASNVIFAVHAAQAGTIHLKVEDIPIPPTTTTESPPSSPTAETTVTGPASGSTGPSSGSSPSPTTPSDGSTDGSGATGPEQSSTELDSSTSSAEKVIVGPVLVLVSMLVLWSRV